MATNQSISDFYTSTLGANLANARWSWGAVNPVTNELFLRVWADDIEATPPGERIPLYDLDWNGTSPGYPERMRHIEALRDDALGYGVVCTAATPATAGARRIKSFDRNTLLKFGSVHLEEGRKYYAEVVGRVPLDGIARRQTAESTLVPDLAALLKKGTTAEALVNARVGEGQFRTAVLKLWGGRCCVTGVETTEAIRASHIKPWKNSTDPERLDPYNGLPLIGTLDLLFDAGLITFAEDGSMLISEGPSSEERERLGIRARGLRAAPDAKTSAYLAFHRETIFRGDRVP